MKLTSEQVKGRIKNVAKQNNTDARILMRLYMMERFLERVSVSQYKDKFVIKGGMLVTAMVGVALRTTMDIDTAVKSIISVMLLQAGGITFLSMKDPDRLDKTKWRGQNLLGHTLMMVRERS